MNKITLKEHLENADRFFKTANRIKEIFAGVCAIRDYRDPNYLFNAQQGPYIHVEEFNPHPANPDVVVIRCMYNFHGNCDNGFIEIPTEIFENIEDYDKDSILVYARRVLEEVSRNKDLKAKEAAAKREQAERDELARLREKYKGVE